MATQAQINLAAYKSGKTPEEIQRLLVEKQGMTAPAIPQVSTSVQPRPWVTQQGNTLNVTQDVYSKVTPEILAQAQNKGFNVQAAQPWTQNTTAQPWSVASLLGDWFWAEDPFIQQYTQDQLNQYNQVIDETAIRKQKESELQAQIDAINAVYADRLRQEKTKGQGRLGSGRALQARSGLIGSDFGAAQTENISQLNREQEQSVENERLALVNQLLSGAQKSAADEIAAKRLAKEAGGREYLNYLANAQTRKTQRTQDAARKLLALGKSPQDITDEELRSAGISRTDLITSYTDAQTALAQQSAKDAEERAKAQLEQQKTQAEIDKIAADIQKIGADASMYYEVGNQIFEKGTNNFIGYASKLGGSRGTGGGGGGGSGSWTFTIDGQVYNSQLYSGLKSPTATAVRWQVSAFKSEPTVTNFNQIQEWYLLTKSISDKTKNPTDDQALIYSLAKALDPGSVVREGEYATVQKYAQSWVDAYGTWVSQALNGTWFLSEKARKNIKSTIESKYNTSKKTYDNLYKQYEEGINSLTGRQDGAKFIKDYTVSESGTQASTPEVANNNPLWI